MISKLCKAMISTKFITVIIGLNLLLSQELRAQSANFRAEWPLSANLTPTTSGKITAVNATFTSGTGGLFTSASGPTYSASGMTGTGISGRVATACSNLFNSVTNATAGTITPYMEFSVSPNTDQVMTVSSISFSVSTSNGANYSVMAAGYSIDGGTNFTGFTPTVTSGTTTAVQGPTGTPMVGTVSLAFTLPSTVIVKDGKSLIIRIVIWRNNASNSTGSIFTISPLVITGTTNPIISAPTATFTHNSASLGVSISPNSSVSSITSRGTVYANTSPVSATDNALAEGGTSLDDFTQTRALTPQTKYFFRSYMVTTASQTYLSEEISFRALSAPPTSATSANTATTISDSQIDLTWTGAAFPASGATAKGYLLLQSPVGTTPGITNINGTAPLANANTTIVSNSLSSTATSYRVENLIPNTRYNFVLIPYTWDGTNAETYNYFLTGLTSFGTTTFAGPPSVSTSTISLLTHNSVRSGGTNVTDGGVVLDGKGVVWSTSANPTITNNKLDAGTATADFISDVTGLSPQTTYYLRAYATNNSGTRYGSSQVFTTYSSPVTAQASNLTATGNNTTSTKLDFTWVGATFPGTGATNKGYILLAAIAPNTPTLSSNNGQAPAAGANTTLVSSSITGTATTYTSTNLSNNVSYNFLLIPYTWDGTNNATYNYLKTSAPTASSVKLPTISGVTTLCAGQQITLSSNSATGNTWFKDGVAISGANAQQYTVRESGTYSLSVNWGTSTTTSVPVNLISYAIPVPNITSSQGTKISKGFTTQLSASDGVSYRWSPNIYQWIDNVNIANPTVKPDVTTTFTVTVTNANGCSSTESITIEVVDDYKVTPQTMLTPNGDGKNDVWIIKNIDAFPDNEVKIFDLTGREVYRKKRYNNSWDGTLNGEYLPTGTYSFVIYFGEGKGLLKGSLTILR
ncbi:MAG: gliding motility-associated C-terminal domain-containing protein [Chitinophagaceae bacterium]